MASSPSQIETHPDFGMSERIRSFGWSETPLGAMETWPDALKISLSIAEHSAFPMAVYWGEDLRLLYNDPWAPFLGERHPWALGRPAREVWSDIWDIVGPQLEQVFATFPRLRERTGQAAGTLSGGEQQMLAIGRALLLRPQLLLLDEPSMGLAPLLVKEIFRIIAELNEEGRTVLLVEQNSHKALQIADYAYVLDRGRIVLEGTGQSLLNNEQVVRTYLGGTAL